MSYTQKALLVLLGIFLLPGLFLFLFYRPKSREYNRLQFEVKALDQQIAEAKEKVDQLPEINKKLEGVRSDLLKLEEQYPRTIEPFYKLISGTARNLGVNISTMLSVERPIREEEQLAVQKRYVRIEATCSYKVLGEFLDEISRLPLNVSVSGLEIEGNEEVLPEVEVILLLAAYLTTEEG